MSLVQITRRVIEAERVPRGEQPLFELELNPNQRILDLYYWERDYNDRKTVDHYARLWVETRL